MRTYRDAGRGIWLGGTDGRRQCATAGTYRNNIEAASSWHGSMIYLRPKYIHLQTCLCRPYRVFCSAGLTQRDFAPRCTQGSPQPRGPYSQQGRTIVGLCVYVFVCRIYKVIACLVMKAAMPFRRASGLGFSEQTSGSTPNVSCR